MLSGNALMPWAHTKNPKERVQKHALYVGCNHTEIEEMVKCLKKLDGKKLVLPHVLSLVLLPCMKNYFNKFL